MEYRNDLTMASLFDGIGGFPLAAVRNGIVPVWAGQQHLKLCGKEI
jgi:hypothetical protein